MMRTAQPPHFRSGQPQFSPDGRLILVNTTDGKVVVWPWRSGGPATIVPSGRNVYRAAFSPDGKYVVTGHTDGATRVWAWRSGRLLAALPATGRQPIIERRIQPRRTVDSYRRRIRDGTAVAVAGV